MVLFGCHDTRPTARQVPGQRPGYASCERLVNELVCGPVKGPEESAERSSAPGLDVTVRGEGEDVHLTVVGELDIATSPRLYTTLDSPRARAAQSVVADLTGVTFIDSSGLRALLTAAENLAGRLQILPSAACLRLFAVAHVEDLLPLDMPDSASC
jgi:anti-anti-sigma factor